MIKDLREDNRNFNSVIPQNKYSSYHQAYENNRYCAHQYSSARIRDKRRSFILYKQIPPEIHKESIKKYTQILSKKKQKQGGLDSFWMFKK